jgi:hypothetical protein
MEDIVYPIYLYIQRRNEMNEELRDVVAKLAADETSVYAYKKFLESTDRLRYFGYVDKRNLKVLCRNFNYTDTRSFVKGGITAAVIIGTISLIRKSKEETEERTEENV